MIVGSPTVGHLLCRRGAEARRRGYDRRCGCLGAVGWQSGDRGPAGRRVLGGRARSPGLSGEAPGGYTCHFVRPGWVLPKRQKVDDVQPAAGPRRNRLHCRCHCAVRPQSS